MQFGKQGNEWVKRGSRSLAEKGNIRQQEGFMRALNLLSSEGLEGALMVVERMLDKDMANWEAWGAKADILYLQGAYWPALNCCEKALDLNPDNALVWNTKGNILYRMGKYEDAIASYSKAIELEPLLIRAWHNKKLALEAQLKGSARKINVISMRNQFVGRRSSKANK